MGVRLLHVTIDSTDTVAELRDRLADTMFVEAIVHLDVVEP